MADAMVRRKVTDWAQRQIPTQEEMKQSRFLKPIAHRILRSELWRFTRQSVPRGVALGLLAAFLVPIGQIFAAAFLALPVRANVPIAALLTFVTNPFTYPFWVVAANRLGEWLLRVDAATLSFGLDEQVRGPIVTWMAWLLKEAAVTAFGFFAIAVFSAALGYVVSAFAWRFIVAHRWSQRPARRDTPA